MGCFFSLVRTKGRTKNPRFARAVENGDALPRVLACEKRQIPFVRTKILFLNKVTESTLLGVLFFVGADEGKDEEPKVRASR